MNSAEIYMQATTKLHALGNTMLNGVTPSTLEYARQMIGITKELFDVIDSENRQTLADELFRRTQAQLREANRTIGAFYPLI